MRSFGQVMLDYWSWTLPLALEHLLDGRRLCRNAIWKSAACIFSLEVQAVILHGIIKSEESQPGNLPEITATIIWSVSPNCGHLKLMGFIPVKIVTHWDKGVITVSNYSCVVNVGFRNDMSHTVFSTFIFRDWHASVLAPAFSSLFSSGSISITSPFSYTQVYLSISNHSRDVTTGFATEKVLSPHQLRRTNTLVSEKTYWDIKIQ